MEARLRGRAQSQKKRKKLNLTLIRSELLYDVYLGLFGLDLRPLVRVTAA